MLILEEHARGKGAVFARRHAKWLSEMRIQYGDRD